MFPNIKLKKYLPAPDSNGYYSFILWEFMNIFGSYMEMGLNKNLICSTFVDTILRLVDIKIPVNRAINFTKT